MSKISNLLLIPTIASVLTLSALAATFTDVNEGDTYYLAISSLAEEGVIQGYDDSTFKSAQEINRAEAVKMILTASGLLDSEEVLAVEEEPFTDTPAGSWYTPYLAIAKEKGLINGYEDGSFHPEETINLAGALKILLEASSDLDFQTLEYPNIEELLFYDTPYGEWYTPYTMYAGNTGTINIYSSNNVNPNQTMTRGYLAEIIYRNSLAVEGFKFGKATFYGSAVQGSGTASGETFDMNAFTAAHKTLPFGSIVEVTNMANGKSVEVRITDRGPYGHGRVLDLSSGAFKELSSLGAGVIDVKYQIIHLP